jgi:hypothetical protein
MSKGNDKKPKAGKDAAHAGISPYKAAQATNKPAASPFSKKPSAGPIGRKGTKS